MKGKTGKCILLGAGITVVMAFPVAGLLALVYRFPVPFAGYVSGFSAVGYAMGGVVIYGLLGGFPRLALLGGACRRSRCATHGYWRRQASMEMAVAAIPDH